MIYKIINLYPFYIGYRNIYSPWKWQQDNIISPNSIALEANYVTVDKDRAIMSVKYGLSLLVKTTHHAARSLCDSWGTCLPLLSLTAMVHGYRMVWRVSSPSEKQHCYFPLLCFLPTTDLYILTQILYFLFESYVKLSPPLTYLQKWRHVL